MIILYIALGLLAALIATLAINTLRLRRKPGEIKVVRELELDEEQLARNLSGMIQIQTVTTANEDEVARDAFIELHEFLEKTYPLTHKVLEKETVNGFSLLYRWPGSGSGKRPYILLAHSDVVAVSDATLDKWKYPPFSGEIAEGYVWGRGALDCKGQLANIMESVEYLLAEGFAPDRDVYIAFGHDEESMGYMGMRHIVDLLLERGVHFEFVLDEGGAPANGRIFGIDRILGAVGIAEKRYVNLRLVAESKGGHAARPPKHSAVGDISRAVAALERRPFPTDINPTLKLMLSSICGHMKFPLNVIMSNTWLTQHLLKLTYSRNPAGASVARTTIAPTMLSGSAAPNVLADRAEVILNMRLLPGHSLNDAIKRIEKIVGKNVRVEIAQQNSYASRVSSVESDAYRLITRTIEEVYPGSVMMPHLTVPVTDSRWFENITDDIYRFEPHKSIMEDGATLHAAGERIRIDSLREGTEFFIRLIKGA